MLESGCLRFKCKNKTYCRDRVDHATHRTRISLDQIREVKYNGSPALGGGRKRAEIRDSQMTVNLTGAGNLVLENFDSRHCRLKDCRECRCDILMFIINYFF